MKKGELVIQIEDVQRKAAVYDGRNDGESYKIRINSIRLYGGDSLLHELVHHSRMVDESRDSLLLRTRSKSDTEIVLNRKDRSLEEAATTFEALARQNNYLEPVALGYYGRVFVPKGRNPFKVIQADREPVAGSSEPGSIGLRGTQAKDAVDARFNDSAISNLVLVEYGSRSAKDRLKELERMRE